MSRRPPCYRPRAAQLRRRWACAWLALAMTLAPGLAPTLALSAPAEARCLDEDRLEAFKAEPPVPTPAAEPRLQMLTMVREALGRSQLVGAAALMASAALHDIEEVRAAKYLQANVGGGLGPGGSRSAGVTETVSAQLRAGFNVGQLLYDSGRTDRLTDWRVQLAESARYGHLSEQEQLALTTVNLALERSRYRMQVQIHQQLVRKMSCLVQAMESVVKADRGRASELVHVRKGLEQAELAQSQTQSLVRQVEVRLRRLVGDGLASTEGLATVFSNIPAQEQLLADVERAYDMAQLGAQVAAANRYADAVATGSGPQLSWLFNTTAVLGSGVSGYNVANGNRSGSYALAVTVNIPILAPSVAPATNAARQRAQAAALQRADALDARRYRVAEVFEQAQAGLDRARRLVDVLRSSEQVRNHTMQQWQQLGRRSLFDVMSAESDHYSQRLAYVNALHDVQQLNANLLSLGRGVNEWLR